MRRKALLMSVLFLIGFSFSLGIDFVRAEYPEKKIRFITSYEPGGLGDITARNLTHYVNPYLGGNVFVENISGASGAIGFRTGAKAKPDGYTLTMMVTSITVAPHLTKDYPTFDLFDFICVVAQDSIILTVKPDSQFKTAEDLISYAKTHPGKVTVALAGGVGGSHHIGMVALSEATGAKFSLVPYKGTAPALVAAMGGHVDAAISNCASPMTYVEGKKLRPLVIFGTDRSKFYPDVPTVKELGYDVVIYMRSGVGVPKGTPKEVKDVLIEAFRKATEDKDYKQVMGQTGMELIFLGPEESFLWFKAQHEFYKNLTAKMGLKPE